MRRLKGVPCLELNHATAWPKVRGREGDPPGGGLEQPEHLQHNDDNDDNSDDIKYISVHMDVLLNRTAHA